MCKAMTSVAVGKILPVKTNWFFHVKSSIFVPKSTHSLHFTCHSTCPLPQRVLLSKRTGRLHESFSGHCGHTACSAYVFSSHLKADINFSQVTSRLKLQFSMPIARFCSSHQISHFPDDDEYNLQKSCFCINSVKARHIGLP